jgi:predicted MFS family arabinose efflux permease
MTFATGAIVANIYYAQPLEAVLAEAFHASTGAIGLMLTLVQLGYALGLALLVPLGDLRERRGLVVVMLGVTVVAQLVAAFAPALAVLTAALTLVGVTSVAAQVLVPFAAHLAPPGKAGTTVSTVMSGLLIGILASRVVAGLVAHAFGWHAVFLLGAALTALGAALLWHELPVLEPDVSMSYPQLLKSVVVLLRDEPVLRWRIVLSACGFASFSAIWTNIGFLLAGAPHGLNSGQIGLFSLFGVAGAVGAQFAGRLADRGWAHRMVGVFLLLTAVAVVALWFGSTSLVAVAIGLVLFDMGVQGAHISNQTIVFALRPEARSRMNSAYMTLYFLAGAGGSALSALAYAAGGWPAVCVVAGALPLLGCLLWLLNTALARRSAAPATAS